MNPNFDLTLLITYLNILVEIINKVLYWGARISIVPTFFILYLILYKGWWRVTVPKNGELYYQNKGPFFHLVYRLRCYPLRYLLRVYDERIFEGIMVVIMLILAIAFVPVATFARIYRYNEKFRKDTNRNLLKRLRRPLAWVFVRFYFLFKLPGFLITPFFITVCNYFYLSLFLFPVFLYLASFVFVLGFFWFYVHLFFNKLVYFYLSSFRSLSFPRLSLSTSVNTIDSSIDFKNDKIFTSPIIIRLKSLVAVQNVNFWNSEYSGRKINIKRRRLFYLRRPKGHDYVYRMPSFRYVRHHDNVLYPYRLINILNANKFSNSKLSVSGSSINLILPKIFSSKLSPNTLISNRFVLKNLALNSSFGSRKSISNSIFNVLNLQKESYSFVNNYSFSANTFLPINSVINRKIFFKPSYSPLFVLDKNNKNFFSPSSLRERLIELKVNPSRFKEKFFYTSIPSLNQRVNVSLNSEKNNSLLLDSFRVKNRVSLFLTRNKLFFIRDRPEGQRHRPIKHTLQQRKPRLKKSKIVQEYEKLPNFFCNRKARNPFSVIDLSMFSLLKDVQNVDSRHFRVFNSYVGYSLKSLLKFSKNPFALKRKFFFIRRLLVNQRLKWIQQNELLKFRNRRNFSIFLKRFYLSSSTFSFSNFKSKSHFNPGKNFIFFLRSVYKYNYRFLINSKLGFISEKNFLPLFFLKSTPWWNDYSTLLKKRVINLHSDHFDNNITSGFKNYDTNLALRDIRTFYNFSYLLNHKTAGSRASSLNNKRLSKARYNFRFAPEDLEDIGYYRKRLWYRFFLNLYIVRRFYDHNLYNKNSNSLPFFLSLNNFNSNSSRFRSDFPFFKFFKKRYYSVFKNKASAPEFLVFEFLVFSFLFIFYFTPSFILLVF